MFARRHYEAIAAVLKAEAQRISINRWTAAPEQRQVFDRIRNTLADAFDDDNADFDRSRFYKACEP
jgi:hypothetical protein